jgi:hypothetical protein
MSPARWSDGVSRASRASDSCSARIGVKMTMRRSTPASRSATPSSTLATP